MSKRVWSAASAVCAADGYGVTLDGRPLRLPSGAVLRMVSADLAQAIATEWQQAGGVKGGDFSAADVPLTGLAGATQERVGPNPAAIVQGLRRYAEADALCYRSPQPKALAIAEAQAGAPWLDWAADLHSARLQVTTGIIAIAQPAESLRAVEAALVALTIEQLAALGLAVPLLGSCVLGLALAEAALSPAEAYAIATTAERFQEQQWGIDLEAADRRARIAAEIEVAARFMDLCRA